MAPCDTCSFREFIVQLGAWFEGMAKFVAIMARHNDEIYTGELLMIQKLERETFKLDKFVKELRARIKAENDELIGNIVHEVQERILAEETVRAVLTLLPEEFTRQVLTDGDRHALEGHMNAEKLMDRCLYEPIRTLFGLSGYPHRLYSLDDHSIPSRLFVATVNAGAVSVVVGERVTPVVMEGTTARMLDAFSVAELIDSDLDCAVNVGGYRIEFGCGSAVC